MSTFTIVAILVAVVLLGLVIWRISTPVAVSDPGTVVVSPGSISGETQQTSNAVLPRSFNQPQGETFTYAGWILVNDYTFNYGQKRTIFSKGDCPGVYLDSTSNSLLVVVNTYGASESILVSNLPAKKWIHLGVVVDQDAVNIYINGVIRQHHTLAQLPKQNTDPVVIGGTAGWDGVLSNLTYYSRSLSASDIDGLSKNVPKDDMHTSPAGPQYFDMSWYTGRT
jgi:Concanavalin A-like lectin/glucanases superfamily